MTSNFMTQMHAEKKNRILQGAEKKMYGANAVNGRCYLIYKFVL